MPGIANDVGELITRGFENQMLWFWIWCSSWSNHWSRETLGWYGRSEDTAIPGTRIFGTIRSWWGREVTNPFVKFWSAGTPCQSTNSYRHCEL